jgi:hypothetical protein
MTKINDEVYKELANVYIEFANLYEGDTPYTAAATLTLAYAIRKGSIQ